MQNANRFPRWPVVLAAVCTVGIMAGVPLLWYLANYRQVEVRNPDGEIAMRERMTDQEVEEFRQAMATEYQTRRADMARRIAERHSPPIPTDDTPVASVDYMSPIPTASRKSAHLPFEIESGPGTDQAIGLTFHALRDEGDGEYVLPLDAENGHHSALKSLTVSADVVSTRGRRVAIIGSSCGAIPAGGKVRLAMKLVGVPVHEVASMILSTSSRPVDADQRCWQADPKDYRLEASGRLVLLTGRISSPGAAEMHEVSIECDFYTAAGEYVGSSQGRLPGSLDCIPAGQTVEFEVSLDPSLCGFLPEAVSRASVRVIGREQQ